MKERLKHVADVLVSTVDKKSLDGQLPVALCNYTDVYYNDRIVADLPFMVATATRDQIARFSLRAGDVLITKDSETANDIAVPAYVPSDLAGVVSGYHLAVLRPRHARLDGRYLYWALISRPVKDQFALAASGVTRFGLRHEAIGNAVLPLHSMSDQLAIADYLDQEMSGIDLLIQKRERLSRLLAERRESAIASMIAGSDSEAEPIALMNLVDARRPIMYGIVLPGPNFQGGVPIIKGGDVEAGRLRRTLVSQTDPEIDAAHARSRVKAGDLVFAIRGSYGAVAAVPAELDGANITQDAARIAPGASIDPTWLHYALETPAVRSQVNQRVTGATIKGLNIRDLKRIVVPTPPLNVQVRIARSLDAQTSTIDALRRAVNAQTAVLRDRRTAAVAMAVTNGLGSALLAD